MVPASTLLLAPRVQAQEGVRARQVLIDIGTESDAGPPEELAIGSITALKQKLEDVLSGCGDASETTNQVVTQLRNGGILVELGSDEVVEWFSGTDIQWKFLSRVHPDVTIKTRDYHIVVQFVLLSFWTGREVDLRELEEINRMQKGIILHARWIKPVARRSPAQTCGHAIFSFSSPHSANDVLANGMFVQQKKVYAEKCKGSP